jgi:hypothetical protein
MYTKLKELLADVRAHTDLTQKSIPYFTARVNEIRVELLKISNTQGEQLSRDVSDATRLILITQREDLNNIMNYPKEVPKYLGRVRDSILRNLAFVEKQKR